MNTDALAAVRSLKTEVTEQSLARGVHRHRRVRRRRGRRPARRARRRRQQRHRRSRRAGRALRWSGPSPASSSRFASTARRHRSCRRSPPPTAIGALSWSLNATKDLHGIRRPAGRPRPTPGRHHHSGTRVPPVDDASRRATHSSRPSNASSSSATSLPRLIGLVLLADRDNVLVWPVVVLWAAALTALPISHANYRAAGVVDRRRMQWIGWAVLVAAEVAVVSAALSLVTDWPNHDAEIALAASGLVPLALAAGTVPRLLARVDRLLTHTVSLAGLTVLIVSAYLLALAAFGRKPNGSERSLLLLSMLAAAGRFPRLPAGAGLADRSRQPGRVRRASLARRGAAHLGHAPHPCHPARRAAAATGRDPAQVVAAAQRADLDRRRRPLRGGGHGAAPPGGRVLGRRQGARGGQPRRRVRRNVARHLAARVRRSRCHHVDSRRTDRPQRRAARAHRLRARRPTPRRSPRTTIACSPSWPARSASLCTTCNSTRRCRHRSTSCATPTRSCAPHECASSPPATPNAASWSATSTMARSSTSSRWQSSCAWPRTRSPTTRPMPSR